MLDVIQIGLIAFLGAALPFAMWHWHAATVEVRSLQRRLADVEAIRAKDEARNICGLLDAAAQVEEVSLVKFPVRFTPEVEDDGFITVDADRQSMEMSAEGYREDDSTIRITSIGPARAPHFPDAGKDGHKIGDILRAHLGEPPYSSNKGGTNAAHQD